MPSDNTSLCRACLKTLGENCISLDANSDLLVLFKYCTGLRISPTEKAGTICIDCELNIKSYAKFKRKCLDSDEIWQSLQAKYHADRYFESKDYEVKTEPIETDYVTIEQHENIESCDVDNSNLYKQDRTSDINSECGDIKRDKISLTNIKDENFTIAKKKKRGRKKKLLPNNLIKPKISISSIDFCGLCNFEPKVSEENRAHLSDHWSKNDYKCYLCDFTCHDSAELIIHRYTHIPSSFKVNKVCHICDKAFRTTVLLEFHYRSTHLQKPGGYCPQCRKSFSVFNSWRNHIRLHKLDRFICDHCGKKFLYRYEIEGHLIDIGSTRNFICEACGKRFKRKFALKTHVESVHSSEAIKCSHCDKVFKSQVTYKDHMKVVNSEKPYVCVDCGKTYRLESALRSHMFWHSGERPHACDVCGLRYKSKGQLKIHKRNHTGHMPYKCKECEKCFTSSNALKRHQSVHTGRRPHRCTMCERTFHYKKMLYDHFAVSHPNRVCVEDSKDASSLT